MLRIDDADVSRLREEYVVNIFETLRWLGIRWEIGPQNPSEFYHTWSQHHRKHRYVEVLQQMRESGNLFACMCTRSQIRNADESMTYHGTCLEARHSFDADQVSWRLRTPESIALPFVVVRQKDGNPAYNLASVVDDVDFAITHIVRGLDLTPASEVQTFMAGITPALAPFIKTNIEHHPLITDSTGKKLSKTSGDASTQSLQRSGITPEEIFTTVAAMIHRPFEEVWSFRTIC